MSIKNIYDTVVCHPTTEEPPLFKRFPFSAELMGPYHNRCQRNKSIKKLQNEIEINSLWGITQLCKTSKVIDFAINDLRQFLDIGMEVRLNDKLQKTYMIILRIDKTTGVPESHKIEISDKQVKITGADDLAVMRGVFFLEKLMLAKEAPFLKKQTYLRKTALPLRLYRSPVACYYKEAQGHYDGEHYHDNILSKIVHNGFSGIWVKAWLRDLIEPVGFNWANRNQDKKCDELKRLIGRASDYGLSVYLHMQEPQGFRENDSFWKKNRHLRGDFFEPAHEYALCSSTPEVKEYLEHGFYQLFSRLPELGGITMITASEHQSHCFSRVINPDIKITFEHWPIYEVQCSRCKKRTPQEVVAEILNLAEKGIHRAKPDANIIAWNWSWSQWEKDPQAGVLKGLSEKVIVMSDFERGGKFKIFDDEFLNDEYSLTYVGPSERFIKTANFENRWNKHVLAKLQISTTHEAGTLPHLPVIYSVAEKMHNLRKYNCRGGMFTWNFGCFTSIITELTEEFYFDPVRKDIEQVLKDIASRRYGVNAAVDILNAWKHFSDAGKFYPRDAWSLSFQPLNHGPAYPLFFENNDDQSPSSWQDTAVMNHRLEDWIHPPWTVNKRIKAFKELLKRWEKGLQCMGEAEKKVSASKQVDFQQDFAVAKAFKNMVLSDINVTKFADLRKKYYENKKCNKKLVFDEMKKICANHLELNSEMRKLIAIEPRIGYHGEAHYMFISNEKLDKTKIRLLELFETLNSVI
ncbi:MAG: hypothetical protein WCV67_05905 [Victivallaceae bacterium]|jgi:hypothetical protein